jgi:hypothetical protein
MPKAPLPDQTETGEQIGEPSTPEMLKISQTRFGHWTEFEFGNERLGYTAKDYTGGRQFYILYETLKLDSLASLSVGNMLYLRRLFLVPLLFLIASFLTMNTYNLSLTFMLLAVLSVLVLIGLKLLNVFAVEFTLLPTAPPAPGSDGHLARVIKDKQHDRILAELDARWRERMRAVFGKLDLASDPDKEEARFKWLNKLGVINDADLTTILAQLTSMRQSREPPADDKSMN